MKFFHFLTTFFFNSQNIIKPAQPSQEEKTTQKATKHRPWTWKHSREQEKQKQNSSTVKQTAAETAANNTFNRTKKTENAERQTELSILPGRKNTPKNQPDTAFPNQPPRKKRGFQHHS
jgi:hypothetical protein